MSGNNGYPVKRFLLMLYFIAGSASTTDFIHALETEIEPCHTARWIAVNTVMRDTEEQDDSQCYTLEVPAPQLLALEVSSLGGSDELRIGDVRSLGEDRKGFDVLERLATRQLLYIRAPDTLCVCVNAQDPQRALGNYKLSNLLTGTPRPRGGDPREEEPDPDPQPRENRAIDAGPHIGFDAPCRAIAEDDHGDTYYCATPLHLGGEVKGEIWNAWGDDEDVFVFFLDKVATIRLEALANGALFGGLYDRYGHRLQAKMRNGGTSWYVVKTLAAGLYAVRMTGRPGGTYHLRIEAVAR